MRLWPFSRTRKRNSNKSKRNAGLHKERGSTEEPGQNEKPSILSDYHSALRHFKDTFEDADDFVAREIAIGEPPGVPAAILYVQGLSDKEHQSDFILETTMLLGRIADPHLHGDGIDLLTVMEKRYLAFSAVRRSRDLGEAETSILSGETVFLVDGAGEMLIMDTKGWPKRGVDEPATEAVVRGPRDGFTETMRVNVSHIRRRLRTPRLAVKEIKIGRRTRTDVTIMYMNDLVDMDLLDNLNRRLHGLEIDGIVDSAQLEQLITDRPYALLPLVERTERPDKVAASLLEGRIAIVVDNSPFVLIVPATSFVFFQASEDYYETPLLGSLLRLLRFVAAGLTVFGTAFYVAIVTFHQEVIPFSLMLRIVATHEGIPLGTLPTAVIMEIVIEILREAGVRLPRPVGSAVSIVGAIIIGDAAVSAGFVPPGMVIVVSLATISSFTIPAYNMAVSLRLARFPIILAAGALGMYGLVVSGMFLVAHIASLSSFGFPYSNPLDEGRISELGDKLIALPYHLRAARRPAWSRGDTYRQGRNEGKPPAPRIRRNTGDGKQDGDKER